VSLEFLNVAAAATSERFAPVARSPMERQARAAGARIEIRDGWAVAVAYDTGHQTGWADMSHLGKLELQAEPDVVQAIFTANTSAPFELGSAQRADGAWWCALAPSRLLIVAVPLRLASIRSQLQEAIAAADAPASLVDVTSVFAALTIAGPQAREMFARFCALDLRPHITPPGSVRPGSVARQPGVVICEGEDRFLMLFGWAVAEYMWQQVQEAGQHLGAGPVGVHALGPLQEERVEAVHS
jgi:heterotetrameric sarcosine oxidase gamma subunit